MKNTVKYHRDQEGMSQTDLALVLNVSRQTIHSIETGKFVPTTVLALKIAKHFNKSVEEIFQLEEKDLI